MTARQTIDLERIIGEVAQRHNLLLRRDDPILVTISLNEAVLGAVWERMQSELAAAQDQIAAGTAQHLRDAKLLAERLVTAAAEHIAAQTHTAANEAIAEIRSTMRAELAAIRETSKTARKARESAWWAVAVTVAAAAITITIAAFSPLLYGHSPAAPCRSSPQLSAARSQ